MTSRPTVLNSTGPLLSSKSLLRCWGSQNVMYRPCAVPCTTHLSDCPTNWLPFCWPPTPPASPPRAVDKGFRSAPLIRFVGQEDGLLSHTGDGPRAYLNIEDYLFYNRGRVTNKRFKDVMAVLTGDPACNAKCVA